MVQDGRPVAVDGRTVRLTNLDKVLYPGDGFTKADVIDYYHAVADTLLGHLAGRPVTLRRYPEGVTRAGFFEKNAARHAPDWVPTVRMATPGSARGLATAEFVLIEERASLVWVANLAALELHVPQWTVARPGTGPVRERGLPDLLIFDLDPGPGTDIVHCCRVAELLRAELTADGLGAWPKTSGSAGLQLYTPVTVDDKGDTSRYARTLAQRLAVARPDLVVSTQAKAARNGRVLIDWSQNNPAKTTVSAYSLRARQRPTVSTPVTWSEVSNCGAPEDLTHTARQIRQRLTEHGDLLADLHSHRPRLPPAKH